MPIDPRKTFQDLVDFDRVDDLLAEARKTAESFGLDADDLPIEDRLTELANEVKEARALAGNVVDDIRKELAEKTASQEQKLVLIDHILSVASRLIG